MTEYKHGDHVLVRGIIRGGERINGKISGYPIEFADRHRSPRVWISASEVVGPFVPSPPDGTVLVIDSKHRRWFKGLGKLKPTTNWFLFEEDDDQDDFPAPEQGDYVSPSLTWDELWSKFGPLTAYKEVEI